LKCFKLPGDRILVVAEGDITRVALDAIVNPANTLMVMGGGVAGAIKRVGGEEIEREAMRYAPVPIGEAIVTKAGRLPSRFVIHAPTVEKPGFPSSLRFVELATRASLRVAVERGLSSIAFPALGAGVGGLSVEDVAEVMTRVIAESPSPKLVALIARDSTALKAMEVGVRRALNTSGEECNLDIFKTPS